MKELQSLSLLGSPLAGAGHAQQQGGLIGQQGRRDPHQNVPPGARCAAAVPPHHAQKEQSRQRQLYEMDSAEQRVALIARTVFGGGELTIADQNQLVPLQP